MKCPECGFMAKSKSGLATHTRSKHGRSELLSAALRGDQRGILQAAIVKLTQEIDTADGSKLPGLVRELRNLSRELHKLPKEGDDVVDEIARRRDRRRAKAARR